MPVPKSKEEEVNIVRVDQGRLRVNIVGTSPIILNRMSEKASRELLMPKGRMSAAERQGNLKHDPLAEFRASPYLMPKDSPTLIGQPASAFKSAMRTAALDLPGATAAKIGRLVYVEGDLVGIYGEPKLFMAITRSAGIDKTPDVRTRMIVPNWACQIDISFVQPIIRIPAVANLISAAGITAGIGDWRPEKGKGAYGRFRVADDDDQELLALLKHGRALQEAAMANPDAYDRETEELLGWYEKEAKTRGFVPSSRNGAKPEREAVRA